MKERVDKANEENDEIEIRGKERWLSNRCSERGA
jgi:hypothetical protein